MNMIVASVFMSKNQGETLTCTDVCLGYRSVPLKNGFSETLELACLLVYIDIQQVEVRVSP